MDDDARLNLTKKRLKIIHRSDSLEEISIRKIVQHIKFYLDRKNTRSELKKLPWVLRLKILSKLTNQTGLHDEKKCRNLFDALPLLLSSGKSKHVTISGLKEIHPLSEQKEFVKKALKLIAKNAENLQSLIFLFTTEEILVDEKKFFKVIIKMKNLRKLQLENGMVKYSKLRKLCKKLKHLEHLIVNISFDCNLDKFTKADFVKFKASFSRLRVFLFRETEFKIKRADETSGRLINLFTHFCLLKLPNLEIVHNYANCYAPQELELGRPTFRLNEKRLALQHLCTVPAHEEFHVNFPNVINLKVIFELKKCYSNCEIDALLRFTKIDSLTLMNVDCGYAVNKILDAYGHNLRVLKIGNPKCRLLSLKFNRVFSQCPKLETLFLDNVDMLDSSEKISSFGNLIDFEWNVPKEKCLVHLSNILSAPKLKRVSLSCKIYQNSKDLQQLSDLIKEQKILQQLESLKMTRTMFINLGEAHDSAFNEMSDLIKNASAFLPKLKELNPQFYFYSTNNNWPLIMRSFENDTVEDSSMDLNEKRAAAAYNWLGEPDLIKFLQAYRKD